MHQYFILNKPYGYLSQFLTNDKKEENNFFLGELYNFPKEIMAVGRLDKKSEGLLLLTTDGKFSAEITGKNVEKEYYVQVDGDITQEAVKKMQEGVLIGFDGKKYLTKPALISKLEQTPNLPERSKKIRDDRHGPTSWISVVITEGKFKQVRKMTSAVGFPTLRLVRVRIGNYKIEKLQPGEVKEIQIS